ncbi:hypothetical protein AJ80_05598 [Polytolypa hystricis UAMH7299]|uniref:MFS maltose permease n=1 Tax=Polytolypa hystricis (strain UAMH7299) TaxID=1447883 RepID=A0A2B7Y223_POLH7|nr:hypothetical protein AJ80_05598 [Polytolypa hystricis UAMH7299]
MLRPRSLLRRIPDVTQPLRPPKSHVPKPSTRLFTSNSQLLLISSPLNRPQLPFLHSPTALPSRLQNPITFRQHTPRLISTERRKKITDGLKIGFTAYALLLLCYIIDMGLYQEKIERIYPTPPEWSLWTRWWLRSARAKQEPERFGELSTDWVEVGEMYRDLVGWLEDVKGEGKGVKEIGCEDGGAVFVDGLGKTGYDIEGMSEAWRTGYFQALMGAAECAEKLDGWVADKKIGATTPASYMVGPSNPDPKRVPPGVKVPREEFAEPAYDSPELYYMRVLTTTGFKPNQKLDAALAYADWLDFKGLKETSEDMYGWAMDIATSGLRVDAGQVVDNEITGVLKDTAGKYLTDNLQRVTTAYGVHQVRGGDLSKALSVFLSLLRARRELPTPPTSTLAASQEPHSPSTDGINRSLMSSITETLRSYIIPPPYPLSTRTGNEPIYRTTATACDEAGLMVYIGEILFASSSRDTGLSWTRDAVDMAESTLVQLSDEDEQATDPTSINRPDVHERCRDCLRTGLANWRQMVHKLVVKAENEELETLDRAKGVWFGAKKMLQEKEQQRKRWEAEELILVDRTKELRPILGEMGMTGLGKSSISFP